MNGDRRDLLGRTEPAGSGCRATNISRALPPSARIRPPSDGVSIVPGHTQLQRIPLVMKSIATALVSATTAPLVDAYTYRFGAALVAATLDAMFTIAPPPRSIIPGRNARITRCIDLTFRSNE